MLFLSGDGYGAGVSADVDDVMEITVGVVERVVDLLVTAFLC